MNSNIQLLYNIAQKKSRIIIGLMSGTSLDGLDVALCRFSGSGLHTKMELLHFETVAYTDRFKTAVKSVFSKKQVDLEKLTLLHSYIALQHAGIINTLLVKWNINNNAVDMIASHGQTVYHAPKNLHGLEEYGNATLQIGDGDHIAVHTGITTLSDFRQKNIAAGGEGAPLAVYGDYLLFFKEGEDRILLNIGGIANFTFLSGCKNETTIFSTDVGPGNTLMDAYVHQHYPDKYYDEDAQLAKEGVVNDELLANLKDHDFFTHPFPKTTGPELFNMAYLHQAQQQSGTENLSNNDVLATLNKFSADGIVAALNTVEHTLPLHIYCSGGGIHNPLLLAHIQSQLPHVVIKNTDELFVKPDAKEAVLFAVLANEALCGGTIDFGKGAINVSMGKISFAK